jgi:hypothetical protein
MATHVRLIPASLARPAAAVLLLAALLGSARTAEAQYPDARIVPRGTLRFDFAPEYISYSERFASDGTIEPLGTDFSDPNADVRLIPSMWTPQDAIRSIIGDADYTIDAGAFRTTLDGDIRRFPLNLELGISNRLSITASIPLVTTRAQVNLVIDSTSSDMGVNDAALLNEPATRQLMEELEAGAAFVESQILAGGYGCPASAQCAEAQTLVSRTRTLVGDLMALTGVLAQGVNPILPPNAPLESSSAGLAVTAAVEDVKGDLATFGATPVTQSLVLPTTPIDTVAFNNMLVADGWGYGADPLSFVKYSMKFGDAEVGVRWSALQGNSLRAVVGGTVRLPTGKVDTPENFVDIGTGDKQIDVALDAEAVWRFGSILALAGMASYTFQLSHNLDRRITPHTRPIAIGATQQPVSRNLGDFFEVGLYPTVYLSRALVAYGSAYYYYKTTDRFALTGSYSLPPDQLPTDIADLEFETSQETLSFGAGIHYFSTQGRHTTKLPIEAGIDYRTAFQGTGGMTPKSSRLTFYLRLYLRLWGRGGEDQPLQEVVPGS